MNSTAIKAALETAKPQLLASISGARDNFMASFGDWVQGSHKDVLAKLVEDAGLAKLDLLAAATPEAIQEAHETFETFVQAIDTLALADEITGKAHARAVMKSTLRLVLNTLAGVAGSFVAVVVTSYVPIPGIGALAGQGVTSAIDGLIATNADKLPLPA